MLRTRPALRGLGTGYTRRGLARRRPGEAALVPPHAVHGPAGRLQAEASVGLGGHRPRAVRSREGARDVQRLPRRARARGRAGLRRHLLQRAPPERLRPDAVAEPDRRRARAPHARHRALRDGQLARALQPADARGGRVRDARRHLRRPAHRRLPRRHADGHLLRLRPEPEPAPRALLRGARPDPEGVDHRRASSRGTAATTSFAT